mmetsp:Transcript_11498/g.27046  ORF Transcript_11498/g.27046 Transcript_11498/m.27046 type:complete len:370 (-) Transcript_11498:132-1241(-)
MRWGLCLLTVTLYAVTAVCHESCAADSTPAWKDLSFPSESGRPPARYRMGMVASGSKLYIFGGSNGTDLNDLHEFDTALGSWTDLSPRSRGTPPSPRSSLGMAATDTQLFFFGGWSDVSDVNDLHAFDVASRTWTDLSVPRSGSPPSPRPWMGMAATGSKLYIFGGWAEGRELDDLHEYDIASGRWEVLRSKNSGPGPRGREMMGMVACGGQLYIFGGYDGTFLGDLHAFDIDKGSWSELSSRSSGPSPSTRSSLGMAALGSTLYVFGGRDAGGWLGDMYAYDVSTAVWTNLSLAAMPPPGAAHHARGPTTSSLGAHGQPPGARYGLGMAAVGSKLFVYGGRDESWLGDLHAYDTEAAGGRCGGEQLAT